MKNACGRLVTVAALIAAVGLTLAGTGTGVAHDSTPSTGVPPAMPPHPAIIRTGTCDVPGQVVYPLDAVRMGGPAAHELAASSAPAVESGMSDVGQPDAMRTNLPVEPSTTLLRTPLADLLTATRAITIYWSEHDITPTPIACGEINGTAVGPDLTVVLHEMNGSGAPGVAWLHDNGDSTTTVALFLAPGLLERGDDAAPTPAATPEEGVETIPVTLTEFRIAVPEPALRVNQRYTFAVTNDGTLPHEFVIERPGAVHEPLAQAGGEAMIHEIAPGATATLSWTFTEPGIYQFACHEPGHFESGQVLAVAVAA